MPAAANARRQPLLLTVEDVQGSYTIPHIQTARELALPVAGSARVRATLLRDGTPVASQWVTPGDPVARFDGLGPGEYAVRLDYPDGTETWERVGVGSVLAALGDSLTEGYLGRGFWRSDLNLTADCFPPDTVSRDGRNFPQFAPTTHRHRPSVNCFQSWLTRLNDRLSEAWHQPVFVANEGWGGYTTGQYLEMMRTNQDGWRDRMELLLPNVWLIHLGVNDDRQQADPENVGANLRGMVDILQNEFGAAPGSIYIARPSYDYAPGAAELLRQYCGEIDALVADLGLRSGPDFFAAFSRDRERWYGSDPVHPGPKGMDWMADLWLDALAPYPPEEAPP